VTRLGELLLARMKRNSRATLTEVWDPETGFAEPDAELVGYLFRHREELTYWMRAVLTLQPDGNSGWLHGKDLTLRRIVWMRMPNSLFTGLLYILADGDATGLTDAREVGGGLRDSVLVDALSQLDGG
jgi:hypothetical protein